MRGTRRLSLTVWAAFILTAMALVSGASRAEAATRTWKIAGTNWSDPANWVENVAPVDGDDLVFPSTGVFPTINDIFNLRPRSIRVVGQYMVSGQPIIFGEGGFLSTAGDSAVMYFDNLCVLGADQTWDLSGLAVFFTGDLRLDGHTVTFGGAGASGVRINGHVVGTGTIVQDNFGDVRFNGFSTFAGQVIVQKGRAIVTHPNGLGIQDGSEANGTIVRCSTSNTTTFCGSLVFGSVATVENEAIVAAGLGEAGQGALRHAGATPVALTGPVRLVGDVKVGGGGSAGEIIFKGPISGTGRLIAAFDITATLASTANTFSGGVALENGGTLAIDADEALPGAPPIALPQGTSLQIRPNRQQTISRLSGPGLLVTGNASTLVLNDSGEATFTGRIDGAGGIQKVGPGHLTLTGGLPDSLSFAGALSVFGGTVTIRDGAIGGTVGVGSDGRLSLTSNGRVAGQLGVAGRLQLTEGGAAIGQSGPLVMGTSALEVGGSVPAAMGRLAATGIVDLGNGFLTVLLPEGFSPTVGTTFTIIENDGTDAIGGTFSNLASEGTTFTQRGITFAISYVGGSGNDVVLTVTQVRRDYFLSEGATGGFFTTDVLIANPNTSAAPVTFTFLKDDGTTVVLAETLAAQSHRTLRVNDIAGLEATTFSTVVRSEDLLPIMVERTMAWDARGYGAHTEKATDGATTTWYFAEGSQGFFSTYLLLANPQASSNHAIVQYLLEGSHFVVSREYPIAPSSRLTVDLGADPELANRSFGMSVFFDHSGTAERAMYFGASPLWSGGHASAGVTATSTSWFLAEGATGPFFETFVLLANPNSVPVSATLTYLPATGQPVTATKVIPGIGRVTVNLEAEDPSLANAAVATRVSATLPIIVERSQYWPDPASTWYEAHNSFGLTALGTKWGLAEGRVGETQQAQTYILIANPGATEATVTITFLRENALAPVTKTFHVAPTSRFNVAVGGPDVPELANERFGALISASEPIAVERALYWNALGQTWAAGTNATAARLP